MDGMNGLNIIDDEVSVGEWIVSMILLAIPIVNLVMLCVWAFGNSAKPSKKNFAKATLIVMAAMIVFVIFMLFVVGSALMHLFL